MTAGHNPETVIAEALAALRRRHRRSALAGEITTQRIHVAEVADVVAARSAPTTVGDVARELTIDPSQASRRVRAAVEGGYVARSSVQRDGRFSQLRLTADGRRLVDGVQQRRREMVREVTRDWSADDVDSLARLLDRFVRELESPTPT